MMIEALLEVAAALARFPRPWFFGGGWAIDLHLGAVTREHHDVDVLIFRDDQLLVQQALASFPIQKIIPHPQGLANQGTLAPWGRGERLELPIHQFDVRREPGGPVWFQLMLGESDGTNWIFRRDPRITQPLARVGFHPLWGLPYLAPEIV